MPELNANIPSIECYVRGNYLRDQADSHDKHFPCVIFGVTSIPSRSPLFHFLMEDGGVWWRMPISAFCARPDVPEVDIHELVLWNSFSSHVTATEFYAMRNMRMTYVARSGEFVNGKYLFTLDWHAPDDNILNTGFSQNPGQHKCGHVILRDDGNFAIQPNNRVRLFDPSFTTKSGTLIERKINTRQWDVEDALKWRTSDDERYEYGVIDYE
jgi:hypothetical protein